MKQWKVKELSKDHKPEHPEEKKRILATGKGSVQKHADDRGNTFFSPYSHFSFK